MFENCGARVAAKEEAVMIAKGGAEETKKNWNVMHMQDGVLVAL
jgi:hypothetical protein